MKDHPYAKQDAFPVSRPLANIAVDRPTLVSLPAMSSGAPDSSARKSERYGQRRSEGSGSKGIGERSFGVRLQRLLPFSLSLLRKARNFRGIAKADGLRVERSYDSSLFRALMQTTWQRFLFAALLETSNAVLITTSSLVTKRLIELISTSYEWNKAEEPERMALRTPQSLGTGIALAIGLALMQQVASLCHNHSILQAYTCGEPSGPGR